jgi:hypothetical protein
MNKENLQLVIDEIRAHQEQFNYRTYGSTVHADGFSLYTGGAYIGSSKAKHRCGSVYCICGFTNIVNNAINKTDYAYADRDSAASFLGISDFAAYELFIPARSELWDKIRAVGEYPYEKSPYHATASEIITVLEAIRDDKIDYNFGEL